MKDVKSTFKNSNISTVRDFANRFIWSAFEYYLRQETDCYIVFSPVKYFKSIGLIDSPITDLRVVFFLTENIFMPVHQLLVVFYGPMGKIISLKILY